MIHYPVKQGSDAWNELRIGKPTASNFEKILTSTGKLSKQSEDLMYLLAAERILGHGYDSVCTAAMQYGREMEAEAAAWYAFERNVDIEEAGICFTDDNRIGASPDRFVSGGGLLEIKAPANPGIHLKYYCGDGIVADYKPQIQGQLFVCEAEWLDTVSYYPSLPKSLKRIHRDEEYIGKLHDALTEFCDRLDELERRLRTTGAVEEAAYSAA